MCNTSVKHGCANMQGLHKGVVNKDLHNVHLHMVVNKDLHNVHLHMVVNKDLHNVHMVVNKDLHNVHMVASFFEAQEDNRPC